MVKKPTSSREAQSDESMIIKMSDYFPMASLENTFGVRGPIVRIFSPEEPPKLKLYQGPQD